MIFHALAFLKPYFKPFAALVINFDETLIYFDLFLSLSLPFRCFKPIICMVTPATLLTVITQDCGFKVVG